MKQMNTLRWLAAVLALSMVLFTGCSTKTGETDISSFSYSDGIDENGFWEGIKALKKVTLCDYSAITIPSETYTITEDAIQTEIDDILADYTTSDQVTDRAIVDGDTVNIDYVGSVDGVEFENGSTEGAGTDVVIGVTNYIDDFLQQLIGHKPGESFDIEVTFPEDYGVDDLNGKDAVFAITVNYITETSVPELTDAFVSENLSASKGWTTVEEMKADILSDLQDSAISGYIQNYVVDNTTVKSLPDSIFVYQENATVKSYQDYADYYQMELDDFLAAYVGYASKEELLESNLEANTNYANYSLIMQAIAEDAGITVSDEDISAFFVKYFETDDYSEYETEYGMNYLKQVVLYQNVLDYIKSTAVLA